MRQRRSSPSRGDSFEIRESRGGPRRPPATRTLRLMRRAPRSLTRGKSKINEQHNVERQPWAGHLLVAGQRGGDQGPG